MPAGTVKFYNGEKGFGFISKDDGSGEIFVHITNCAEEVEELVEGRRVRFDEQISKRSGKLEAIAVSWSIDDDCSPPNHVYLTLHCMESSNLCPGRKWSGLFASKKGFFSLRRPNGRRQ